MLSHEEYKILEPFLKVYPHGLSKPYRTTRLVWDNLMRMGCIETDPNGPTDSLDGVMKGGVTYFPTHILGLSAINEYGEHEELQVEANYEKLIVKRAEQRDFWARLSSEVQHPVPREAFLR